ncbi:AzlD domain-containing protein [Maritimibacter sp. 55A14]|uniref:AzlD domain-containing protein n=1 Tax=Maritimibacter sp. 55A14 TaxID=2174844 RepID=UPI000D619432|nr:AzlD domain-containing protein [Maritimibacter sp. 55A14]PWE32454.1 AzlD domain-containing protein [Maritimibacter sp. 55A14]
MTLSTTTIWTIIVLMGIGTWLLRFSFIGLIGNRKMPEWALRHLRYTPVAVMPGLIAPLVLWPRATGGETDPARLAAAGAALVIGLWTKNVIAAVFSGMGALYLVQFLTG